MFFFLLSLLFQSIFYPCSFSPASIKQQSLPENLKGFALFGCVLNA
ncbi:hypothetical protein RG47T_3404 [Mucilaginibacter polytrichastri]|uniref:Uncharacterized protein n=1 Tax=Mucilaginibacter polytrichastri TaxID=1302689 RepID=A0A1Q6A1P8_9SPHI|nr:hypothetical protein RG47T_3404 [Mucilaginibacter polytrichastri]